MIQFSNANVNVACEGSIPIGCAVFLTHWRGQAPSVNPDPEDVYEPFTYLILGLDSKPRRRKSHYLADIEMDPECRYVILDNHYYTLVPSSALWDKAPADRFIRS